MQLTSKYTRSFLLAPIAAILVFSWSAAQNQPSTYYPKRHPDWERRAPEDVGLRAEAIKEAVAFAQSHETEAPRSLETAHYQTFGREPFGEAIGPHKERGEPTGLIIRKGYVVAEWGDPRRVDMTFSVTKSFVSTTVGLALQRGLIRSLEDPVTDYVGPILVMSESPGPNRAERFGEKQFVTPFASPHNAKIAWDHLLRQTSDWEGTLWGKPDWADRPSAKPEEWVDRPRKEPGTSFEYNDVRVNLLALAAQCVWRRPLPDVLREFVMDVIGASSTWQWYGYENSWVIQDGRSMQAATGGGHWGGGMFISALDMARFGYLTLRRGQWEDHQVLSEDWITKATTPTRVQPDYGFMNWYLNTDRKLLPSAPAQAFAHLGNGTNMIYVDPENDLVIVARWIDRQALDGLVGRVLAGIASR
ncbi:MAG: class C beta-lactamase-related serine hydrolase [Acidobacteria bacterium]|nr:MAG: class C beta-lactamase-related serine hydrolase [Acidobacteriota bacterium]